MAKNAVPNTPKARKQWLMNPNNRDPIKRGGAGSIYYVGDIKNLESLNVIVSMRAKSAGAGLAHFGGLSEPEDTVPSDEIATGINNAAREGREEMAELLGYEPSLDTKRYTHLYTARDDAFFINNGHGFAVDARLHAYPVDKDLLNQLFPDQAQRRERDKNHSGDIETSYAELIKFTDALSRQDDYFYAHEYFSLWVMSAKISHADLMPLIHQVNAAITPKRVDFEAVAARMNTDIATLESYLGADYKGVLVNYETEQGLSLAKKRPHNQFKR